MFDRITMIFFSCSYFCSLVFTWVKQSSLRDSETLLQKPSLPLLFEVKHTRMVTKKWADYSLSHQPGQLGISSCSMYLLPTLGTA